MERATTSCPACHSPRCEVLGAKHSERHGRDYSYHRCAACEFIWVHPFPGYDIYDEAYYRGKGPDPFLDYESEYADYRKTDRAVEFADLLRVAERHFRPVADLTAVRWLDFGCGAGGFLKFLRDRGSLKIDGRTLSLDMAGHDIGAYADRLKSVDGFEILSEDTLATAHDRFDIISCIEVAEHVLDVRSLIQTLSRLLAPGGLLILTTGNLTSFAARRAGLNYRYLIPEIHISLFNPTVLTMLYQQHGLAPLAVRYQGVVRYKVIKSLPSPVLKAIARLALRVPFATRLIDAFYGVSAMPCAVKVK